MNTDYSSKKMMKYSTQLQVKSPRQGRQSQPLQLKNNSNFSYKKLEPYSNNQIKTTELFIPNRLSRNSNNKVQSSEKLINKSNVQKLVSQLKTKYWQEPRSPRCSNLIKASTQVGFFQKEAEKPLAQKEPNKTVAQLQNKILQYSKNCSLTSVKSQPRLIELNKSPDRSVRLNQKTQRCRQICEQIKRKLFKETVSTTSTEKPRRSTNISDFKLGKQIGSGKFSKVYMAIHKKTGFVLAIKIIKKETIKKQKFLEQLIREIKIQSFFNHVNLVKLYAFFQDNLNFYLLTEYCVGGQLYNIFKVRSKIGENQWQPLMRGVCEGLYELHRSSVIHRDLKPQNIMLSFDIPKIGDFGWSVYNTQDRRDTFCGTPLYISPQLLLGNSYEKEVDIWALGVMMYEFLTGRIPFKIQHDQNLLQIVNSNITYPPSLSSQCIELLKMILEKDPTSRIAIMEIIEHPFLNSQNGNDITLFNSLRFSR